MSKCKLLIRFLVYFLSGVVILYLSLIAFNFYKFRNCHYIVNVYDGMGNQLYQYSFGHILAQETGRKVCYTYGVTFDRKFHLFKKRERQKHEVLMLDKFNIKDDILLNDHFHIIASKFLGFTKVKYFDNLFAFHKNEELVFKKNKTYFARMLFSEKYFNKYRNDLLKLFELKVPLSAKNKEMLKEIKKHKNSADLIPIFSTIIISHRFLFVNVGVSTLSSCWDSVPNPAGLLARTSAGASGPCTR